MPMRLSGLVTGMDTEALVGQLMSAQSLKKKKTTGAKTKLEWKQDAWKELNKKLTSFYNGAVSKMRLASSYNLKKASLSDTTKASINAGTNAVVGNYTMEVKEIASAQFLTSAETSIKNTSQKLSEIDPSLVGKEITVKGSSGEKKLEVTENTKVSDFINTLQKAGLNASYDTTQKKFFISSKGTGEANAFSISTGAVSDAENTARNNLKSAIGYDSMSSANKTIVNKAMTALQSSGTEGDAYDTALNQIAQAAYDTRNDAAKSAATNLVKAQLYDSHIDEARTQAAADKDIRAQFYEVDEDGEFKLDENGDRIAKEGTNADLPADYDAAVEKKAKELAIAYANEQISTDENQAKINAFTQNGVAQSDLDAVSSDAAEAFGTKTADGLNGATVDSIKADIADEVTAYASVEGRSSAAGGTTLSALGLRDISSDEEDTKDASGMAYIKAKNSHIILNGADLYSSSSTVSANGLDISLTSRTAEGEKVSFSVSNDIDAVYDSVKKALKEYNDLMKEMKEKYNAASSKGYEPLTSEEKRALSDDEVEEWEKKIKDSLFRRDSKLEGIMSGMRSSMMATTTVNGKSYSLSSFGIMTSSVNYQEGGLLHIYGDPDDEEYSGKKDKLKAALTENPEDTITALTNLFEGLRSDMYGRMRATEYSSALTFYDDKQMNKDLEKYKTDLKAWDDKMAAMEEAYYKKFAAMETAMAKLQAQQSQLGGLFGMS